MAPPKKKSRIPTLKRKHGWSVLLFILGTLFPPLAVAARFGIGTDFWINLVLTICGYFPGHGHNFYIQNIRNNKTHARTPKWAQRYGLVDTTKLERNKKRSQWQSRYNDRLPASTLEGQAYEEGQDGGSSIDVSNEGGQGSNARQQRNGDLWNPEDESFYGEEASNSRPKDSSSGGGRWHYPANFDDAVTPAPKKSSSSSKKKDRWARTEDAYSISEERSSKKKVKRRKSRSSVGGGSALSRDSTTEFPEDAGGGLYGDSRGQQQQGGQQGQQAEANDPFEHEF